ncbi:MAG: hypothetical protein WCO29_00720, partial [Nostocales cyanobacterium ELA583]
YLVALIFLCYPYLLSRYVLALFLLFLGYFLIILNTPDIIMIDRPVSLPPDEIIPIGIERDKILSNKNDFLKFTLLTIATIIGIFFNILWEKSSDEKKKIFSLNSLKPLLISPIVLASIWGTSLHISDQVSMVLFAFQNGFFWQGVFNKQTSQFK